MKKLICVLLIVFFLPAVASAERVTIKQHYSLFIDSPGAMGGREAKFGFDSLCIDLYLMSDDSSAYICISRCEDGFFLTSGIQKLSLIQKEGFLRLVEDNGQYFDIVNEEDNDSLWISYNNTQYRLIPVQTFSALNDMH